MSSPRSRKSLVLALLLIAVGSGWLLSTHEVIPGVDWIWVLSLAVTGFLVLFIGGVDKLTVVLGPFLIISTVFSLLRQTGRISADTEVPCLLIVGGVLALISYFLPLRAPDWLDGEPPSDRDSARGASSDGAGGGASSTGESPMVGRVGVVKTRLDPQGTVAIGDAVYAATTTSPPVAEGTKVRVDRYDRSFLVVETTDATSPEPS